MPRKKHVDQPNPEARLAKLMGHADVIRLVRQKVANLKKKKEWTIRDLAAFVAGVDAIVNPSTPE